MDSLMHLDLRIALFLFLMILLLALILIKKIQDKIRMEQQRKRRMQIGKQGEDATLRQLEMVGGYKRILRNLYVPLPDGRNTTEIDGVMLHVKGVFVLENKNYAGKIYGDEEGYQWVQVQKRGRKKWKNYFYNPVLQNQTHIRHLKNFLLHASGEQPPPCFSLITFNDSAKLRRIPIRSKEILVSESRKVRRRLDWRLWWMPQALTRRQVDQLYETLKGLERPGRRVRKQHGKYLKRKKE